MVEKVIAEFGQIDILVNNAGITRDGLFIRMKSQDWNAVINTNLTGIFNCTKVAAKYMMKNVLENYQYDFCFWYNGKYRSDKLFCC